MRDRHSACRGCYWYEQCGENRPCDYYYPITEQYEAIVDDIREAQRKRDYYDEYMEYIRDWS